MIPIAPPNINPKVKSYGVKINENQSNRKSHALALPKDIFRHFWSVHRLDAKERREALVHSFEYIFSIEQVTKYVYT